MEQLNAMKPRFSGAIASPENLLYAYAMAAVLRTDADEWQLFCMAADWKKRRKRPSFSDDQDDALIHVMRFLHGTGATASLPVKQAMKLLRPKWEQNVTPFDLHEILLREEKSEPTASVVVGLIDSKLSHDLLALATGKKATVELTISARRGRAKHLFEITAVHTQPL